MVTRVTSSLQFRDVIVFGPPHQPRERGRYTPENWRTRTCHACAVTWKGDGESACWVCGVRPRPYLEYEFITEGIPPGDYLTDPLTAAEISLQTAAAEEITRSWSLLFRSLTGRTRREP